MMRLERIGRRAAILIAIAAVVAFVLWLAGVLPSG